MLAVWQLASVEENSEHFLFKRNEYLLKYSNEYSTPRILDIGSQYLVDTAPQCARGARRWAISLPNNRQAYTCRRNDRGIITITTTKRCKVAEAYDSSLSQIISSIVTLIPSGLTSRILTCSELKRHWRCLF